MHDFENMQELTTQLAANAANKPSMLQKLITTAKETLTADKVAGEIKEFRENMSRSQQVLTLGLSSVNTVEQAMRDNNEVVYEEVNEEDAIVEDTIDLIMENIENKKYNDAIALGKDFADSKHGTNSDRALAVFMCALAFAKQNKVQSMWTNIDDSGNRGLIDLDFVQETRKVYFSPNLKTPADKQRFDKFETRVRQNQDQKYRYHETLTEEKISFYSLVFDAYDADGGGSIDQDEFRALMAAANPGLTRKVIDGYLQRIDESGDNSIDLDEWLNLMADINENPNLFPGLDPDLSFFKKSKESRADDQKKANAEFLGKGKGKKARVELSDDSAESEEEEEDDSEDKKKKSKPKEKGKVKDKKEKKGKDKGKEKEKSKGKEKDKGKSKGKDKDKKKKKK
jgi:hypothetical protein